jgi:hypothetical protein
MSLQNQANRLAREYETATPREIAIALNVSVNDLFFEWQVKKRTAYEIGKRLVPDFELIRLMRKRIGFRSEVAA